MREIVEFKSGRDLEEEASDDDDTVTCVDCGVRESDQVAYDKRWQLVPTVCPDCLRWEVTSECCAGEAS